MATAPSYFVKELRTNRGLVKFYLLSLITFGIYGIVVMAHITEEVNTVASPYDHRHTMSYWLMFFIFSWLSLGIAPLVWSHRLCERIGDELKRRQIPYEFGASTFWLWGILGSLIIVGPFIYVYKMFRAMNKLNENYNFNKA